jgi:hypothetical protein
MIVSLNEIETTVLKAARGAGMAWGLAEEAAQAARWLAARGLSFEAPLVFLLESEAWRSEIGFDGRALRPRVAQDWLCPIRAGAFLSDTGDKLPLRLERVLCPLLLAPFAARGMGRAELSWDRVTLRFDGGRLASPSQWRSMLYVERVDTAELRPASASDASVGFLGPREGGMTIEDAAWSRLQSFEARVYVPASLESRLSGAGAALSDND